MTFTLFLPPVLEYRKDPSQTDVASKKAMFEKVANDQKPPWAIKGKASYKIRNKIARMFTEQKPQISIPKAVGINQESTKECLKSEKSVANRMSMFEQKNDADQNRTGGDEHAEDK